MSREPRKPGRGRLGALRVLLAGGLAGTLAALPAGCYIPYPVPAGSVVDRTPAGPAEPDPGWSGSACAVTLRQEVLERINGIRAERGLRPLQPHPELVAASQGHTEDQARRDDVTHTGSDGSAAAGRAEARGYAFASIGENVAGGYTSPEAVVEAWMKSSGHRAILLSPEPRHAGLGYAFRVGGRLHHFWTLVVADPARTETTPPLDCHP